MCCLLSSLLTSWGLLGETTECVPDYSSDLTLTIVKQFATFLERFFLLFLLYCLLLFGGTVVNLKEVADIFADHFAGVSGMVLTPLGHSVFTIWNVMKLTASIGVKSIVFPSPSHHQALIILPFPFSFFSISCQVFDITPFYWTSSNSFGTQWDVPFPYGVAVIIPIPISGKDDDLATNHP